MDPRVKEILLRPENRACADCGERGPRWCSVSLGIAICAECAGIHRKLGTHISFVQSASLDRWKDEWVHCLASVGNAAAAELYEAALPCSWSRPRLEAIGGDMVDSAAAAHLERFIRAKYEQRLFARSEVRPPRNQEAEPFAEAFDVLLRRGRTQEPFGLAPHRPSLRRGVLQLRAAVAAGTPAQQWNDMQVDEAIHLRMGDCVVSVNGVPVRRDDAGSSALQQLHKEQQVLLAVRRLKQPTAEPSYEQLLSGVYALFNPAKLSELQALLTKNRGSEHTLFFRVCRKYVVNSEDWHDLIQFLVERSGGGAREVKIAAEAETKVKELRSGEEILLFEDLCQQLIFKDGQSTRVEEGVVEVNQFGADQDRSGQDNIVSHVVLPGSPVSDSPPNAAVDADHSSWKQLVVPMLQWEQGSPLGILHDRAALQERHLLLVRNIVPESPAAVAGLCRGDIVERIGTADGADVALRRVDLVDAGQEHGQLLLTLRRPPAA